MVLESSSKEDEEEEKDSLTTETSKKDLSTMRKEEQKKWTFERRKSMVWDHCLPLSPRRQLKQIKKEEKEESQQEKQKPVLLLSLRVSGWAFTTYNELPISKAFELLLFA